MRRGLLIALLVPAALGPQTGAHAQTPVTGITSRTPIAAYEGRLVWSRLDASARYELVQRVGSGPVTRLPVETRGVPFDVDLGPTSGGRVVAVYSRCKTDPPPAIPLDAEGVRYESGRGCDIYKLDIASGDEVRYSKVNASDASEFWPTYWKGRLAFGRAYDDNPQYPYIYVKDVESSKPSARLPGGSRGTPSNRSTPRQLELYGTRLAFVWRYATTAGTGTAFELRADTVSGEATLIDQRVVGLTAILLGWPGFESGRMYWSRGCFGDPGGCPDSTSELRRGTYASPLTYERAFGPRTLLAHERDAGTTWVLEETAGSATADWCVTGTCSIQPLKPAYEPAG